MICCALGIRGSHFHATRALLRDYVDLRVKAGSVSIINDDEWAALTAEAGVFQNALWDKARRAAEADPSPVPAGMFVQATNDLMTRDPKSERW